MRLRNELGAVDVGWERKHFEDFRCFQTVRRRTVSELLVRLNQPIRCLDLETAF